MHASLWWELWTKTTAGWTPVPVSKLLLIAITVAVAYVRKLWGVIQLGEHIGLPKNHPFCPSFCCPPYPYHLFPIPYFIQWLWTSGQRAQGEGITCLLVLCLEYPVQYLVRPSHLDEILQGLFAITSFVLKLLVGLEPSLLHKFISML